jgi:hypothetical protein
MFRKRFFSGATFLVLCGLLLVYPVVNATTESSVESNVPEEALDFMEDVAQFDLSKYNVTLISHSFDHLGPPQLPAYIVQENVYYKLEQENSKIDAVFHFRNGTFSSCMLYVNEGSPIYSITQPDKEISKATQVFDNYLVYSGVSDFFAMRNLLNEVDKLENTVKTAGNIKLEITSESNSTKFLWSVMSSGAETKALSLRFLSGNLQGIKNYLCLTTVSDAYIGISKEEAVNIATEYASDFSWKARTNSGELIEVKNVTILDSPVKAELSMQPRDGMVLYPYWYIELCLDTVYPGGVSSIHVGLWADTGVVNYCQEISAGTAYIADESETDNIQTSEEPELPTENLEETEVDDTQETEEPETIPLDSTLPPQDQKDSLRQAENSNERTTNFAAIVIIAAGVTIATVALTLAHKRRLPKNNRQEATQ